MQEALKLFHVMAEQCLVEEIDVCSDHHHVLLLLLQQCCQQCIATSHKNAPMIEHMSSQDYDNGCCKAPHHSAALLPLPIQLLVQSCPP